MTHSRHDTNTTPGALRHAAELKVEKEITTAVNEVMESLITKVEGVEAKVEGEEDPALRVTATVKDLRQFLGDVPIFQLNKIEVKFTQEIKDYHGKATSKEKAAVLLEAVDKLCVMINGNIEKVSGLKEGKELEIQKQKNILSIALRLFRNAYELDSFILDEKFKIPGNFCPLMVMLHASSGAIQAIVDKEEHGFADLYYKNYEEFYHLLAQKCISENLAKVPSQNANLIHTSIYIDVHAQLESKIFPAGPSVEKLLGEFISTEQSFLKSFKDIFVIPKDKKEAPIDEYLKGVSETERAKLEPYLALYRKFISDHPLNQLVPGKSYSLHQLLMAFTAAESVAHLAWLAHAMMMQRIIQDQGLFDHLNDKAKTALNNIAIMPPQRNPRYKLLLEAIHKQTCGQYGELLPQLIKAIDVLVLSANDGLRYIEASLKVIQALKKILPAQFKVLTQQFDFDVRNKLELGSAQYPGRIITLLEYAKAVERSKRIEAQQAALQAQIKTLHAVLETTKAAAKTKEDELNATVQSITQTNVNLHAELAEVRAKEAKATDDAAQLIKVNKEENDKLASGLTGRIVSTVWGERQLSSYQVMSNNLEEAKRQLEELTRTKTLQEKELADVKQQLGALTKVQDENKILLASIQSKDEERLKLLEEMDKDREVAGILTTKNYEQGRRIEELEKITAEQSKEVAELQQKSIPQPLTAISLLSSLWSSPTPAPAPKPEEKVPVQVDEGALRKEFATQLDSLRQQSDQAKADLSAKENELKAAEEKIQKQTDELKQQEALLTQNKTTLDTQAATLATTQAQVATAVSENGALQTQVVSLQPKSWTRWAGGGVFSGLGGAFSGTASGLGFAGVGTFAALAISAPGWIVIGIILLAITIFCIYKATENYRIMHAQQPAAAPALAAATAPVSSGSGRSNNASMNASLGSTFAPPSASVSQSATIVSAESQASSTPSASISQSAAPIVEPPSRTFGP